MLCLSALASHGGQVPADSLTLPATPPIGGPVWSIVVPALLFLVACSATYLLYRRFARKLER
jgi:hypothetical protein